MFPFVAEVDAVLTDERVSWSMGDVESCCADDDVAFEGFAVSCYDALVCDFGDWAVGQAAVGL